jgi:hypothetical protein
MAGKKKDMDGGTFGFNPSYENKTINDIAHKIISGKKNENKMKGFRWINLNHRRAEQRINAFFQKLHGELQQNPDKNRSKTLFGWYKDIEEKYPEKIQEIRQREKETFAFVDNFFKTRNKPTANNLNKNKNSPVNFTPQAQNSSVNFTPQAQNYDLLIHELNKLDNYLIPNKIRGGLIELSNEEKEEISKVISNLAQKIYDKAIHLKGGSEFTRLHQELYKLYDIYWVYFIEKNRQPGQNLKNVKGVANNKMKIALNLQVKENSLKKIVSNGQKKPRALMNISYGPTYGIYSPDF